MFGEAYDAPTVEEYVYTAIVSFAVTGVMEAGEIASYAKNRPAQPVEWDFTDASDFATVSETDAAVDLEGDVVYDGGVSEEREFSEFGLYTDRIKWGIHDVDVRPDGKGFWGRRIKQTDPRVDSYEAKINPRNESYFLPHPEGGYVQFENMVNATVQDGKLILQQKSFYHVNDMPEFAKKKVLEEAKRQLAAAQAADYKVEWLVSDEIAVEQLKDFFKEQGVDIAVTYYPE